MPRVEELEPEPRNVPQRPLKREVRREGAQGKRRARGPQMCPALHNLHECLSEERRGAVLHLCQSYPQSQSTSTATTSTSPTHSPPHPPNSSSGTLAVIRPGSQDFSPPRLLSVSHSLSCECCDLWTNRKQCARVIARLRSGRRRGASIRHLPDVTVISIDFFCRLSRSLCCVPCIWNCGKKLHNVSP